MNPKDLAKRLAKRSTRTDPTTGEAEKARCLFVHIGSPKTGTTALQHFLHDQKAALSAQGILYPVGGSKRAAHHVLGAAVFPGRASRLEGQTREEALDQSLASIHAEIEASGCHTVILSTEYLWGYLSPANVRRLLSTFRGWKITVVAYLRRQDLLAQSLYIQAVKGGEARSFGEWLAAARVGAKAGFHFDRVLDAWNACGIPTQVTVRVYEKGQLDPDIRKDFIDTVAPGVALDFSQDGSGVNTAPDMATIELLRVVSAEVADVELANRVRRKLMAQSPPRGLFEPLAYLSQAEAESFLSEFAESNAEVARRYLGRADGVLFRQAPPPDTPTNVGGVPDRVLLARLISMLPQLMAPAPVKPKLKKRFRPERPGAVER